MTRRYVLAPRAAFIDGTPDAEDYLSRTVFEPDSSPRDTGLLDAQGNRICVVDELDPIGFVRWIKRSS